jgi:hypothetical protein
MLASTHLGQPGALQEVGRRVAELALMRHILGAPKQLQGAVLSGSLAVALQAIDGGAQVGVRETSLR